MSLRAKLTLTVAAIVAVAVFGGAYAAHVSAGNALRDETDKFLAQRAAEFVAPGSCTWIKPLESVSPLDNVNQSTRFVLTWTWKFARSADESCPPPTSVEDSRMLPSGCNAGVPNSCGTRTSRTALLLVTLSAVLVTTTR